MCILIHVFSFFPIKIKVVRGSARHTAYMQKRRSQNDQGSMVCVFFVYIVPSGLSVTADGNEEKIIPHETNTFASIDRVYTVTK